MRARVLAARQQHETGQPVEAHAAERLASPLRIVLPAPATMDDAAAACAAATEPGSLMEADAVFAATDVHAVGLLTGLRARGRRVPEDVAVVGLGDLDIARHAVPPLTTLRIDGEAIGHRSAALILASATGNALDGATRRQDVGFTLVRRDSG